MIPQSFVKWAKYRVKFLLITKFIKLDARQYCFKIFNEETALKWDFFISRGQRYTRTMVMPVSRNTQVLYYALIIKDEHTSNHVYVSV